MKDAPANGIVAALVGPPIRRTSSLGTTCGFDLGEDKR